MSWRRLGVLVRQLPRESATWRSIDPTGAAWSLEAHLLALSVDVLNVGNWQRSGRKSAPRPKPIQRPGVKSGRQKRMVGAGVSIEEMAEKQARWSAGTGTEAGADGS